MLLCGHRKAMVIPAKAGIQRGGRRGTNGHPRWVQQGNHSHPSVCERMPMSDWYENNVTRPREWLHTTARALANPSPVRHSAKAGIQRGGDRCGKLGPTRFQQPTPFSRPWCAGPAGMTDWYENDVARFR